VSVYIKDKYSGCIQVQNKCYLLAEEMRKFMIVQIKVLKIENGC